MGKKVKEKVKKQNRQQSQATLAPKRKKLFYAVLLSLPVLFIIILEFALRIGSYGGDTRLFVTAQAEVETRRRQAIFFHAARHAQADKGPFSQNKAGQWLSNLCSWRIDRGRISLWRQSPVLAYSKL